LPVFVAVRAALKIIPGSYVGLDKRKAIGGQKRGVSFWQIEENVWKIRKVFVTLQQI
jgi:hypothetical protein